MARQSPFLIICADDFGLHTDVNEAIWRATFGGVLTAASLMVGAPAAAQAVQIARQLPQLRVGLHVVLTDGQAILPRERIPDLVDVTGRFRNSMLFDSFRFAAWPRLRRQFAAEIRAQFEAFASTGLRLDHVNAHKHFHLHPGVLELILRIGSEWGPMALRVPEEPFWFARYVAGISGCVRCAALRPWIRVMRARLRSYGSRCNDQVFGLSCTGRLSEPVLLSILETLPTGISEIYLHPAIGDWATRVRKQQATHPRDELDALMSPRVADALRRARAESGGYGDID